MMIPYNKEKM